MLNALVTLAAFGAAEPSPGVPSPGPRLTPLRSPGRWFCRRGSAPLGSRPAVLQRARVPPERALAAPLPAPCAALLPRAPGPLPPSRVLQRGTRRSERRALPGRPRRDLSWERFVQTPLEGRGGSARSLRSGFTSCDWTVGGTRANPRASGGPAPQFSVLPGGGSGRGGDWCRRG